MFNPGDKVLVYAASWDKQPKIGTVERTTKTQAILSNGDRYSRADGYAFPHQPGGARIESATPDQLAAIEQADRIRLMRSAIGEYIATAGPGDIEWLYGYFRNRGMPGID